MVTRVLAPGSMVRPWPRPDIAARSERVRMLFGVLFQMVRKEANNWVGNNSDYTPV